MSKSYENVLERLKEERLKKHWSQDEIGKVLHMNQSNYSKVELGKRRLTYYETQCLCESDVDSFYIFSGQHCERKYDDFFEQCSYEELVCILDLIYIVIELLYITKVNREWIYIYEEVKYAKSVITKEKNNENLFGKMRRILEYSQQKMAGLIGVDVKKFRQLENGKILPDSEIIWKMYDWFNIPPALIVKSKEDMKKTICYFLSKMDVETEKILVAFFMQCHGMK